MKDPLRSNTPPPEDVRWFQNKLDTIFGRELSGKSRYLIAWGQDLSVCREWHQYQKQWRAMFPLKSTKTKITYTPPGSMVIRTRYEYHDVGVPRWVILRFIPPEVALIGWVEEGIDEVGHFYDPRPVNGIYEPLRDSILADHNGFCCELANKEERPCYGEYRPPDQSDVEAIQCIKYMEDQVKERRPGPITKAELNAAQKRQQDAYEKWCQSLKTTAGDIMTDSLNVHRAQLSPDPSVRSHGAYHFLKGNPMNKPDFVFPWEAAKPESKEKDN